jgi:hypothetical protein
MFFCVGHLKQPKQKKYFLCRLLKMHTKNENLFLVTIKIISWHHKKILSVTLNYFFTSVKDDCMEI